MRKEHIEILTLTGHIKGIGNREKQRLTYRNERMDDRARERKVGIAMISRLLKAHNT